MSHIVAFAVPKSANLYRLPIATTLIQFIEYDFTYFWEQCLELAHKSRSTGEYDWDQAAALREYIRPCHPYYNVLIHTDFEKVALDCIIDFICHSENIGLEELWVRTISPKDSFSKEVFTRISEYKTGNAINQWANLLRMQEYAAAKASFLFDGPQTTIAEYTARKQYYDLAFYVAASEMGFGPEELPHTKRYTPALLPTAPVTLSKMSHVLLPAIRPLIQEKYNKLPGKRTDSFHDQASGMAINAMMHLRRPAPLEMLAAIESFGKLPQEVYLPTCFKAILDLEFDKMLEYSMVLEKNSETGRWAVCSLSGELPEPEEAISPEILGSLSSDIDAGFAAALAENPALTGVSPSRDDFPGEVPASVPEVFVHTPDSAAIVSDEPADEAPAQPVDSLEEGGSPAAGVAQQAASLSTGRHRPEQVRHLANNPMRSPSGRKNAQNINVRCQLLYTALYSQIGKNMSEEEFQEWSQSLMGIRRSIIKKEMGVDDLEKYLDATDEVYKPILA